MGASIKPDEASFAPREEGERAVSRRLLSAATLPVARCARVGHRRFAPFAFSAPPPLADRRSPSSVLAAALQACNPVRCAFFSLLRLLRRVRLICCSSDVEGFSIRGFLVPGITCSMGIGLAVPMWSRNLEPGQVLLRRWIFVAGKTVIFCVIAIAVGMDASESSHNRIKREADESMDGRDSRIEDDEEWDGSDKRKHRSSNKSRQHSSSIEAEEREAGKRGSGDRNEGRRKSGSSSHADSGDEDDYDGRRESRSKIQKKNPEDRSEKRSSYGYRERETESSQKVRGDESERLSSRKTDMKSSGHEGSQSRSRSKVEASHEGELDKVQAKDSRYPDRKESHRDKAHGSRDQEKSHVRRRWDEAEMGRKAEDGSYGDRSDSRSGKGSDHKQSRERAPESRNDPGETKILDSIVERSSRSSNREEKRIDGDSSRGRLEGKDEDNRHREARLDGDVKDKQRKVRERSVEDVEPSFHRTSSRSQGEKLEKHKQQRDFVHSNRDEADVREKSVNIDDDGYARNRDRSVREARLSKRSHSPERRHYKESDEVERGFSESDTERNIGIKDRERDKDGYRDVRMSKGKDGSWNDRNREREVSKEHWRRGHTNRQERDGKDRDIEFDYDKEWEIQRLEQDRFDGDKFHSRPNYRKDGRGRNETKTSSSFGTVNDHSDTIEIRPNKNLDFGREGSVSTHSGRRPEAALGQDFNSGASDEEWAYPADNRGKTPYVYGENPQERYADDGSPMDQNYRKDSFDNQGVKGRTQKGSINSNRTGVLQVVGNGLQPPFGNNQGSNSINRTVQLGAKGGRSTRGGRGRLPGRDSQRVGIQLPMIGPPFGHLGLPPGPMPPIGPNMSPSPGPPIGPGVFLPAFPPVVWQGGRGVDMNILGIPPALSPLPPPGPSGPRFPPSLAAGPAHGMYFNQPGPGRGVSPNTPAPDFNSVGPIGRALPHDKAPVGWTPPRINGPPGKAPSRGEQNDYSQNFVDTGMRPQNFIRELELTSVVEDYPKLRELIQKKDEIVAKSATAPMYYKCDLREFVLTPEFFGTKFDVILVDPPWEEYVHRAPGVADHMESWTFEEIQNLKIEVVADTPSFIFLWVGDGVGLEQGRQCLKKEHCLMGIKGTVRRSTDGHIIHANIDTDVIIADEPPYG
ncbi:hypothetical protein Taro_009894 [Colocasia esculenta]|uniref:Methyltransferase-like protein 1 n=1 Tax=Colocasia esculenta TaxID=4460 RepID=A0A843U1F8_COLES|nr:hypothetical protein [Colocasia esculenta]